MKKRTRQYGGILCDVAAYYILHDGAHLVIALLLWGFKQINFMGLGVQIDVNNTAMTDMKMGFFCLAGAMVTLLAAYLLVICTRQICAVQSKPFKAICTI